MIFPGASFFLLLHPFLLFYHLLSFDVALVAGRFMLRYSLSLRGSLSVLLCLPSFVLCCFAAYCFAALLERAAFISMDF